jgi:hypothetical protein
VGDPDLRALQERFFRLVTAREDVAGALARLGLDAGAADALVVSDARLDAVGRIGIYNDMYFLRLCGVLAADFPCLRALLGEDDFRDLVADYLDAHPPQDQCLRELGRALPGFVRAQSGANQRPWLPDLAALEWARADLFDRPDADVMAATDLQALAPERFATLPLVAVPAVQLLDVEFAVDELWQAIQDRPTDAADAALAQDEPIEVAPPAADPRRLLVWRQGRRIHHRRAGADESALLPEVLAGTSFGALCERLGQGRQVEEAAQAAFGLLAAWLHAGLLCKPAAS